MSAGQKYLLRAKPLNVPMRSFLKVEGVFQQHWPVVTFRLQEG
uniref:Uncharacterized protein n=1 Tax=Anguilla anguilla TaxID=7936 RepID=A0A0E9UDB7_ANGAN